MATKNKLPQNRYESYATVIGPINIEDLKALRKLVRKAIRNYESNEQFQV